MEAAKQLQFTSPSFGMRLKSMLGVDFYRLFHTPLFYIFLVIAAIIPAMVFGSSGMDSTGAAVQLYTNTWQMVASQTPLYVVNDIGEYPWRVLPDTFPAYPYPHCPLFPAHNGQWSSALAAMRGIPPSCAQFRPC